MITLCMENTYELKLSNTIIRSLTRFKQIQLKYNSINGNRHSSMELSYNKI